MRTRDVPFSDFVEHTNIPSGGLATAHPDPRLRLQGILFRTAGAFVSTTDTPEPTTRTIQVEEGEFFPVNPTVIEDTTTALPLILFWGRNR